MRSVPFSLRTRIAVLCAVTTALVATAAGLALLQVVESELRAEVDEVLERRSDAFRPVIANLVSRDTALIAGLAPVLGDSPVRGLAGGEEIFALGLVPAVEPARTAGLDTITADGAEWRRRTTVVDIAVIGGSASPDGLRIELFEPLTPTAARLDAIRNRSIVVGIVAVVIAAVAGFLLGRTSTAGLQRLVVQASAIGGDDDLERRVDAGDSALEVAELETTLNAMLDRIEIGRHRTRSALASSRAFAADAAHELRTPLTSLGGNIEILERNPDLDPETRAEIVSELAERQAWMQRLLKSLRDLTRTELAEPVEADVVDLAELADVTMSAASRGPDDRVRIVAEGSHPVAGSAEALRIMIDNLVRNALVHGPGPGGSADVVVTVNSSDESDGRWVTLVVDDGGPGIPEIDRDRVRRRFERGHADRPGTGLGLALVDQLVRRYGGELHIGDSPMGGARFSVRLPRSGSDQHLDAAAPPGDEVGQEADRPLDGASGGDRRVD